MAHGVVGFHGSWILALTGALGFAAACGGDDDDTTAPPKGGSAGMAGSAGKGGTAGTSAGKGGTAGKGEAGQGEAGDTGTGGSTGGSGAGKGGKGGMGGTTSTGGSSGQGDSGDGPGPGPGGMAGDQGQAAAGGNPAGGEPGTGGTIISTGGTISIGGQAGESGAGAGGQGGEGNQGTAAQGGEGGEAGAPPVLPNLFFSEYVEPTDPAPDAVEIVNKSGGLMDLAGCTVELYSNGSATATATIALSGTVAADAVFVVCGAAIGSSCDQLAASLDFSGDDAIALRCGTDLLDVFGRVGFDPGAGWGTGVNTTNDHTFRRLCSVTIGDRNATNVFFPSTQWSSVAVDTVADLGVATCVN